MIKKLLEIQDNLIDLLLSYSKAGKVHTMYIDYHKPYVSRIWFIHEDVRVFIHKIEPCDDSIEALYHPHKWDSAMKILSGSYEMGIGHSENSEIPKTDCKLILAEGTIYEMTEKDGWHYVNPINSPCYTLMITGSLNSREMPIEPDKKFRSLDIDEITDILYGINYDISIYTINQISKNIK